MDRADAIFPLTPCRSNRYERKKHPQLQHHRAYRPWQIHAGGPPAGKVQRRLRARDGGSDPRQYGPRARARHHHQGPRRHLRLHRAGRAGLHAQPHRHPGSCGLQLRGLALSRRLRGRAAHRGRLAGHRGADAREYLSCDGARSGDPPRHQQDRPARRRSQACEGGDREHPCHPRRGRAGDLRQARHQHRRGA